jgi:predicted ABC-type ATPase
VKPSVIVLGGANGAGKTTASRVMLSQLAHITEFVNADTIAQGLSGFAPERVAMEAGRIMLARLRTLASQRINFAFETTMASRSFAPWLESLARNGYEFHLFFFWIPSPEFAIARVSARVRMGGHDVEPETIRRRYARGLKNFFELYQPLTTHWFMYNNTHSPGENLIARGRGRIVDEIADPVRWDDLRTTYDPTYKRC